MVKSLVKINVLVKSNEYLSKAALANDFENFIAIGDVIMWNMDVGTLVIIITPIVGPTHHPCPLLSVGSNKIN